tara:strand:- start:5865 stop:7232 length:1368 start_codon:yes stop_codon:yes gene_type:complete
MFQSEHLQEKWKPVLEHPDLPEISDPYRRAVTSLVLENQEKAMAEDRAFLGEAAPQNNTANASNWDPILISLIRRAMPQLIAYDVCGVQPMSGPTGLIFAMKARYDDNATSGSATEALFDEADTAYAVSSDDGDSTSTLGNHTDATRTGAVALSAQAGSAVLNDMSSYTTGTGRTAAAGEALGDASSNGFQEMSFTIDKVSVTALTRALRADYTMELAQDLKAIHGLDAETELANILSTELLAEINREVVRSIYVSAKPGAQINTTTAGIFDLDTDSNGRWSVEKFKGLMYAIERDANAIGQQTRRGKGNVIITSADVASALSMTGMLDMGGAGGAQSLSVDDTQSTFAGTLMGRYKVYIDPYSNNVNANQFYVVGYKGSNAYDAGMFYCPYVPLQMVRAVGEHSFQPKIGFKTRYGMVQNPFASTTADGGFDMTNPGAGDLNCYYRRVQVTNIM